MAIRAYLDALWPAPEAAPDGAHLVVFSPGAFLEWFPLTAGLGPVAEAIAAQAGAHDVYAGVLAQGPEGMVNERGQPGRGTMATARLLPAAFLDLDVGAEGHAATDHPATAEEALRALAEAVPLAPSFVVSTGGGVHPYWLLKAPLDLTEPGAREVARATLLRLEGTVREAWRRRGWHLDSVADLARVLRPAGTVNRKKTAGAGAGDHDRPDGGRLRARDLADVCLDPDYLTTEVPRPGVTARAVDDRRSSPPTWRRSRPGAPSWPRRGPTRSGRPSPPGCAGSPSSGAAPGAGSWPTTAAGATPATAPARRSRSSSGPWRRPGDVRLHRGAPGLRRLRVVRLPGQDQESHPARPDPGPEPPRPRPGAPAGDRL